MEVRPHRWARFEETRPGELTVTFVGSPHAGFFDLDRAEVVEDDEKVVVTLYVGNDPDVHGYFTLKGVEQAVVVALSAPLDGRDVVDGAL